MDFVLVLLILLHAASYIIGTFCDGIIIGLCERNTQTQRLYCFIRLLLLSNSRVKDKLICTRMKKALFLYFINADFFTAREVATPYLEIRHATTFCHSASQERDKLRL